MRATEHFLDGARNGDVKDAATEVKHATEFLRGAVVSVAMVDPFGEHDDVVFRGEGLVHEKVPLQELRCRRRELGLRGW